MTSSMDWPPFSARGCFFCPAELAQPLKESVARNKISREIGMKGAESLRGLEIIIPPLWIDELLYYIVTIKQMRMYKKYWIE